MPQSFYTYPFVIIEFSLSYKKLSLAPVPSPKSLPQGPYQKVWKKPAHCHTENVSCGHSQSVCSTSHGTNQKKLKKAKKIHHIKPTKQQ